MRHSVYGRLAFSSHRSDRSIPANDTQHLQRRGVSLPLRTSMLAGCTRFGLPALAILSLLATSCAVRINGTSLADLIPSGGSSSESDSPYVQGRFKILSEGKTNPIVIQGGTSSLHTSVEDAFGFKGQEGWVSRDPAAEVSLNPASGTVEFLALGLNYIAVKSEKNGKIWHYLNENPPGDQVRLKIDDWPGGKALIYLGVQFYRKENSARGFDLFITDPNRPIDYGWGKAPEIKASSLNKPIVFKAALQKEGVYSPDHIHSQGRRCEVGAILAAQPSAYLELDTERDDVHIAPERTKKDKADIALLGPIGSDTPQCFLRKIGERRFPRMPAGRYAVVALFDSPRINLSKGALAWDAVAYDKNVDIDFFFLPVQPNLPLEDRVVFRYTPFLTYRSIVPYFHHIDPSLRPHESVWTGERIRLFANVPKDLVAFTSRNLTPRDTEFPRRLLKGVDPVFPEAGEPVVILSAASDGFTIMTIDGNIYITNPDTLTTTVPENIRFPSEVRNTKFKFYLKHDRGDHYNISTYWRLPEKGEEPARKPLEHLKELIDKYDACHKKVWAPVRDEAEVLANMKFPTSRDQIRLRKLRKKYHTKAARICKLKQIEPARKRYYEGLVEAERQMRTAELEKAIAHLKEVFGV